MARAHYNAMNNIRHIKGDSLENLYSDVNGDRFRSLGSVINRAGPLSLPAFPVKPGTSIKYQYISRSEAANYFQLRQF